jgi:hypothetical protein
VKPGRVADGGEREALTHVGFKADEETRRAIDELLAVERGGKRAKSTVIRRAIIEAAERLRTPRKK